MKKIYLKYEKVINKLPFLDLIPVNIEAGEIPIYIEVLCKDRDKLVSFLNKYGIETRVFYPNLNSANYLNSSNKFPNSKKFEKKGLFLPSGPDQPFENINYVLEILTSFKNI